MLEIATKQTIAAEEVLTILNSDLYLESVYSNIQEASNLGISSVPYFVFNRKYAISGTQPSQLFLDVLRKYAVV